MPDRAPDSPRERLAALLEETNRRSRQVADYLAMADAALADREGATLWDHSVEAEASIRMEFLSGPHAYDAGCYCDFCRATRAAAKLVHDALATMTARVRELEGAVEELELECSHEGAEREQAEARAERAESTLTAADQELAERLIAAEARAAALRSVLEEMDQEVVYWHSEYLEGGQRHEHPRGSGWDRVHKHAQALLDPPTDERSAT